MTTVFSPHTDDAIFSIGAYLTQRDDVTIVSPMAAIPDDGPGHDKHRILTCEHRQACEVIGAEWINGPFLDDVYPAPPRRLVKEWIAGHFARGTSAFIPFGIHHPDHLLVSNLLVELIHTSTILPRNLFFYEELPYRIDYPGVANARFAYLENAVGRLRMLEDFTDDTLKRQAVDCYQSQISPDLIGRVMVRERIWELVR